MSDTYARRRARQMSDQELRLFQDAIVQEQATRRRLDASPEKITHAITEYQRSMGREDGGPWEQPTSALDSYPQGAVVTYDGVRYVSTTAANVWAPNVSGWRLVPETDDEGREIPPPYVPPTGSHDSYNEGEKITWTDGNVYRAVRSGVVHSPDEYAPDWQLIEPEPEPEPEPPEDEEPDPEDPEPGDGDEDEPDEPTGPEEPEPEEEQPAEWVQPGGHNPYNTGDRVLWQGSVYESVMDGNVWSPTGYPQGWTKVS